MYLKYSLKNGYKVCLYVFNDVLQNETPWEYVEYY